MTNQRWKLQWLFFDSFWLGWSFHSERFISGSFEMKWIRKWGALRYFICGSFVKQFWVLPAPTPLKTVLSSDNHYLWLVCHCAHSFPASCSLIGLKTYQNEPSKWTQLKFWCPNEPVMFIFSKCLSNWTKNEPPNEPHPT